KSSLLQLRPAADACGPSYPLRADAVTMVAFPCGRKPAGCNTRDIIVARSEAVIKQDAHACRLHGWADLRHRLCHDLATALRRRSVVQVAILRDTACGGSSG